MSDCLFCGIGSGDVPAVILYEDSEVVAFLDAAPVRPGHTQVIPRQHHETFDLLPGHLGAKIFEVAQRLAGTMKAAYGVERVALAFTGGDVPHAHGHVIPLHETTDVTSARYIVNPEGVRWSSEHLRVNREELLKVRAALVRPS